MFSFVKNERLCHKNEIEDLFLKGKSFLIFPFKVIWDYNNLVNEEFPIKIVISVPKRNIKKSVERNLLKRRVRESYRLNKALLTSFLKKKGKSIKIAIIYLNKDANNFKIIEEKMIGVLNRIKNELENETNT